MAAENNYGFIKKLMLFLFGLQAIFIPAVAAVKEQAQQKIPVEAVQWITVVTSPWPAYTFGVLFFVILMSILMGLIIYQAIAKTKIFDEGMGGAKGGVQIGITAILTLIVVKFMPFGYYLVLTGLLVLIATFLSIWTLFEAATKYVGAEGKWKNGASAIGMGVILIFVGYFMLQILDQFQEFGVITGGGVLTKGWPGALAWIGIIAGVAITAGGALYGASGLGGGGATSGAGGLFGGGPRYETKRQINDIVNVRKYNTQINAWTKQMERALSRIASLITQNNTKQAKAETKSLMALHAAQLKNLKKMQAEAENAMRKGRAIEGVEPADIARWEGAADQLTESIEKITAYEERLELQVGNGLHLLITELNKQVLNVPIITRIISELRNELAGIDAEGLKLGQASERAEQVLDVAEMRLGAAPAGGGGVPVGGRMRGP